MQKLVDEHPAVTRYQDKLANFQFNLGRELDRQKRLPEAFTALEKGLAILQKLTKADPNNESYNRELGENYAFRGGARVHAGQPAEAVADLRRALEIWAALPNLDIEIQVERSRALRFSRGWAGTRSLACRRPRPGRSPTSRSPSSRLPSRLAGPFPANSRNRTSTLSAAGQISRDWWQR